MGEERGEALGTLRGGSGEVIEHGGRDRGVAKVRREDAVAPDLRGGDLHQLAVAAELRVGRDPP